MTTALQRHRADLVALTFGLAFLAVGTLSLGHQLDWFETDQAGGAVWFGATVATVGVIGVLAIIVAAVRRRPEPPVVASEAAFSDVEAEVAAEAARRAEAMAEVEAITAPTLPDQTGPDESGRDENGPVTP